MSITIISIRDDSRSCLCLGVAFMFFSILCTGFLTVVGINLLIVFVLNVKASTYRLQFGYFSTVIIFGLGSIAVPTYISRHPCIRPKGYASCWFDIYFESSHCGDEVWIWHYSFLMFLVIVGFACSIIATIKLIREQYIKFGAILRHSPVERRQQSALIARVLFRCVLYPLIPFISNIWGFVSQTVVFKEGINTPYELAMFGVVFGSLEGVFITIIFFTDPTVTSILSEQFKQWYRRYVEEYQRITIAPYEPFDKQIYIDLIRNCNQCNFPEPLIHRAGGENDGDREHGREIYDEEEIYHKRRRRRQQQQQQQQTRSTGIKKRNTKSIPVRCVTMPLAMRRQSPEAPFSSRTSTLGGNNSPSSINTSPLNSPSTIYRLSSDDPHRLEQKRASPILTCDHLDSTKAYIPYRYPRCASFLHFIFCLFKPLHQKNTNDNIIHPQVETHLQHPVRLHVPDDEVYDFSDPALQPPGGDYTLLSPRVTPSLTPTFSTGQL
ncbi:hypothetical protein BDA99DRAFT_566631 [Phascolomyces articulosus]|uniref:G protein-coupled receptor n=1 Tax=Phascolomyces articulosus TaxID=60185 RepID=A0AAD5JLF5_9FUNG|nr:hypothetical protein BDA99DRAFT_566631 [Phascolomyces articulosus]